MIPTQRLRFLQNWLVCLLPDEGSIVVTNEAEIVLVVATLEQASTYALASWHQPTTAHMKAAMLKAEQSVELQDAQSMSESVQTPWTQTCHQLHFLKRVEALSVQTRLYEELAELAQGRYQAVGSHTLAKELQSAFDEYQPKESDAPAVSAMDSVYLTSLVSKGAHLLQEHKSMTCNEAMLPLNHELDLLRKDAGGSAQGGSYKVDPELHADMPYAACVTRTADTLQMVDKTKLTAQIRSVALAYKHLREQLAMFSQVPPAEVKAEVEKQLWLGRVTLVEFLMLEGLKLHSHDKEMAITEVVLQSKALTKANLQATELHPVIWNSAQRVLAEQDPQ